MTGTALMPSAAGLLRDFVNTAEPQVNGEELRSPGRLRDWFASHALIPAGAQLDWADLQVAVALREGLRAVLMGHAGDDVDPQSLERLNATLAITPVTPVFGAEGYRLTAAEDGQLAHALASLIDAVRQCHEDHSWQRLKVCARGTCHWAFFDESRNQSRRWCSMAGCGNHVKMRRAYAARKNHGAAS
jgi:predicted RNA-binding Zn ribbon-like protein